MKRQNLNAFFFLPFFFFFVPCKGLRIGVGREEEFVNVFLVKKCTIVITSGLFSFTTAA